MKGASLAARALQAGGDELQRFLSVKSFVNLRLLSQDCKDVIDNDNERVWRGLARRLGLEEIYTALHCETDLDLKHRFLRLAVQDNRRWARQQFVSSVSQRLSPMSDLRLIRGSRQAYFAWKLFEGVAAPSMRRLIVEDSKEPPVRVGFYNLGVPRNVFTVDSGGKQDYSYRGLALRALMEAKQCFSLREEEQPTKGHRITYVCADQRVAFVWRLKQGPIVSLHEPNAEATCVAHYSMRKSDDAITHIDGYADGLVCVGYADGHLVLCEDDQQVILRAPGNFPVSRIAVSKCQTTVLAAWRHGSIVECYRRADRADPFQKHLALTQRDGGSLPVYNWRFSAQRLAQNCSVIAEVMVAVNGGVLCVPVVDAPEKMHDTILEGAGLPEFQPYVSNVVTGSGLMVSFWPKPTAAAENCIDGLPGSVYRSSMRVSFIESCADTWLLVISNSVKLVNSVFHRTKKCLKPYNKLLGHQAPIYQLAVDPDSHRLLTVSTDEQCVLWDLAACRKMTGWSLLEAPDEEIAEPLTEDSFASEAYRLCEYVTPPVAPPRLTTAPPSVEHTTVGALLSDADPPLVSHPSPVKRTWGANVNQLKSNLAAASAVREVPVTQPHVSLDNVPGHFFELAKALNMSVEELMEHHADEVVRESTRTTESPAPPPAAAPAKVAAPKMVTAVALELRDRLRHRLSELDTEALTRGSRATVASKFRNLTKACNDREHAVKELLREMNVRGGIASAVYLTFDSVHIWYKSIRTLQTWRFEEV